MFFYSKYNFQKEMISSFDLTNSYHSKCSVFDMLNAIYYTIKAIITVQLKCDNKSKIHCEKMIKLINNRL